jgi:hypothetical protein
MREPRKTEPAEAQGTDKTSSVFKGSHSGHYKEYRLLECNTA